MAGLLDFFGNGWDDPKSNAVMALAGGLLDGDFAGGMKGYAGVMAGAKDAQFKRAMQEAQMENLKSEIAQRNNAMEMAKRKQDNNEKFWAQDAPMSPGAFSPSAGYGPTMPLDMMKSPAQSGLGGKSIEQVLNYINDGGNDKTLEAWKYINDPRKLESGNWYENPITKKREYIAKVDANVAPDENGFYAPLKGLSASLASIEGDKTRAVERAKAGYSLQEKTLAGGQPVVGTTSQLIEAVNQGGNPFLPKGESPARIPSGNSEAQIIANGMGGLNGLPTVARGGNVSFKSTPQEMDAPRILQDAFNEASTRYAAAQKAGDSVNMNRERVNMEGIRGEYSKLGKRAPSLAPNQAPNTAPQSAPSFGLQLQSPNEAAYQKEMATGGIKAGVDRVMAGYDNAKTAATNITTIDEARKSIAGGAFLGTGAESKLAISKGLQAIGFNVAPDKVTNTDYLTSTLGEGMLSEIKKLGVNPTDSDREELKKIVGTIGKDPQALNKILDFREKMSVRAIDSHNQNYKQAQKGGFNAGFDLTIEAPAKKQEQKTTSVFDTLPPANTGNRGQRIRDTSTGKILRSNGMSWVAE